MRKILCSLLLIICFLNLSACGGNGDIQQIDETNIMESDMEEKQIDDTTSSYDYEEIANAYKLQLEEDCNDAISTFHITKNEYRLYSNYYDEQNKIEPRVLFKLEDLNADGVCELIEVVSAYQHEFSSNTQTLDIIAFKVYTYENNSIRLVSRVWDFYPNGTNEEFTCEYDYTNNQFCTYYFLGGGGMFSEVYEVIRGDNGKLVKDCLDVTSEFVTDPNTATEYIDIYKNASYVDFSERFDSLPDNADASSEEKDAFLNQLSIHTNRSEGQQADDMYLDAQSASKETIAALLSRGTTTIYDSDNLRYYISATKFGYDDKGYYVIGDLEKENAYMERATMPDVHLVKEGVKYYIADGASVFSMCGACDGTIENYFGATDERMVFVGGGFVLLENDTIYGMLYIKAD